MRTVPIVLLCLLCAACSGSDPVAPTPPPPPPPVPSCQANHTADVSFSNVGSKTVDVILDGGVLGTLNPGQMGLARTVAAGVAHNVRFRITNTAIFACDINFNPIPVECSTQVYSSCSF